MRISILGRKDVHFWVLSSKIADFYAAFFCWTTRANFWFFRFSKKREQKFSILELFHFISIFCIKTVRKLPGKNVIPKFSTPTVTTCNLHWKRFKKFFFFQFFQNKFYMDIFFDDKTRINFWFFRFSKKKEHKNLPFWS